MSGGGRSVREGGWNNPPPSLPFPLLMLLHSSNPLLLVLQSNSDSRHKMLEFPQVAFMEWVTECCFCRIEEKKVASLVFAFQCLTVHISLFLPFRMHERRRRRRRKLGCFVLLQFCTHTHSLIILDCADTSSVRAQGCHISESWKKNHRQFVYGTALWQEKWQQKWKNDWLSGIKSMTINGWQKLLTF